MSLTDSVGIRGTRALSVQRPPDTPTSFLGSLLRRLASGQGLHPGLGPGLCPSPRTLPLSHRAIPLYPKFKCQLHVDDTETATR